MSRSNPSENAVNPAVRWFEWDGANGAVRYYDKEKKETVSLGADFTFVLLDELGSVGGFNDAAQRSIYSNEVRDTRTDVLIVKIHKGEIVATGLYQDIKDHITSKSVGGQFVSNCYIAFKNGDDGFHIGSLKLKGAALGAWMDFRKANRAEIFKKAVQITGYVEGKKGSVTFRTPTMKLVPLSESTNQIAISLDKELQTFLTAYLNRAKRDQVETAPTNHADERDNPPPPDDHDISPADDDIPF